MTPSSVLKIIQESTAEEIGLVMPFLGYIIYREAEDTARRRGSLAEY